MLQDGIDGMGGEQVTHAGGVGGGEIEERVQQRLYESGDLRGQDSG